MSQLYRSIKIDAGKDTKRVVKNVLLTLIIYGVALAYFFPVLYMFVTAFKTEFQAVYPTFRFSPILDPWWLKIPT